jgi:DNA-binding CsgD family transcriptional regulator
MLNDSAGGPTEVLYHGHIPTDAVLAYRDHYRSVDLWTNRAAAVTVRQGPSRLPEVWTSGTLVPDAEFLRSEFYADFGRPLGLRYVVGTVVPLGAGRLLPIGLHRPEGAPPFERAHAQLLRMVIPHLRRAMHLRRQLAPALAAGLSSLGALDALSTGILVVDANLNVLVANTAAENLGRQDGPIRFGPPEGACLGVASVRALHSADHAALATLVCATAKGASAGGAVPLRHQENASVVAALVSPLPRRFDGGAGATGGRVPGRALILLREARPKPVCPDPQILRELFGLTLAEAEVAQALMGGATKEAVATLRHSQVSTVRTQVRSILEKTGAANLRDLERILAGLTGL